MDAAHLAVSKESMNFFNLLSTIVTKNKCKIKGLDLETGVINVIGKNEHYEECCYNDLEKYLVDYITRNYGAY